jgi:hypothetical protein
MTEKQRKIKEKLKNLKEEVSCIESSIENWNKEPNTDDKITAVRYLNNILKVKKKHINYLLVNFNK